MRVIVFVLSPRYQLFSEATPRKIVDTEWTIKLLLPEYQVYKCCIILNNCAIQILKCRPFSDGFLVYFISVLLKLIHFHVCAFEEEINKKQNKQKTTTFFI
jgi:hypothetical protein